MTQEAGIAYMKDRVAELGHGDGCKPRIRHFVVDPFSSRVVGGGTSLFLLINPTTYIRVESSAGLFDLTDTTTNELQYEHQGETRLTNYSASTQHVIMIEVIF